MLYASSVGDMNSAAAAADLGAIKCNMPLPLLVATFLRRNCASPLILRDRFGGQIPPHPPHLP